MEVVPKKKTPVRNPWTKKDLRELKAHSKTRTPVVEVAKAMNEPRRRSGKRRRQSVSVLVIAVEDARLDRRGYSGALNPNSFALTNFLHQIDERDGRVGGHEAFAEQPVGDAGRAQELAVAHPRSASRRFAARGIGADRLDPRLTLDRRTNRQEIGDLGLVSRERSTRRRRRRAPRPVISSASISPRSC